MKPDTFNVILMHSITYTIQFLVTCTVGVNSIKAYVQNKNYDNMVINKPHIENALLQLQMCVVNINKFSN